MTTQGRKKNIYRMATLFEIVSDMIIGIADEPRWRAIRNEGGMEVAAGG